MPLGHLSPISRNLSIKALTDLIFLLGFQQCSYIDLRIVIKELGQEKGFKVAEGFN